MKKILIAASLLTAILSVPAHAWGPREQGALIGAASVLGFQALAGAVALRTYPISSYPVIPYPQPYVQQYVQPYALYPQPYIAPGSSYAMPPAVAIPGVPPPGTPYSPRYRSADMYFVDCNCTRTVMVPD